LKKFDIWQVDYFFFLFNQIALQKHILIHAWKQLISKSFDLVRQPLHDFHPSHRLNVHHLPSIPISKFGAINGPGITANTTAANRFQTNFLHSLTVPTNNTNQQQQKKSTSKPNKYGIDSQHNKPRPITIVKQGNEKPHKTITILLNRRTVQTYDQLLADISESFGYQKNRTDKVRREKQIIEMFLISHSHFFFSLSKSLFHSFFSSLDCQKYVIGN
jgi:hypothetical protein